MVGLNPSGAFAPKRQLETLVSRNCFFPPSAESERRLRLLMRRRRASVLTQNVPPRVVGSRRSRRMTCGRRTLESVVAKSCARPRTLWRMTRHPLVGARQSPSFETLSHSALAVESGSMSDARLQMHGLVKAIAVCRGRAFGVGRSPTTRGERFIAEIKAISPAAINFIPSVSRNGGSYGEAISL